ncbi:MAG TPA: RagB/SusD family nutrient uptake outer membrane protein, partial [Bacteroidales bacterium]|nr:RagB/SusD family nutrient uptake outer membrane protein [Bacteroidales bacterium]
MKSTIAKFAAILSFIAVLQMSCEDFLVEDNKTGVTEDLVYTTKFGLDALVGSCYSYSRGWYGKEAAFGLSEGGTDIWLTGYDNRQKILVNYSGITPEPAGSAQKESMNSCFDEYWELLYQAVNTCNTAIKYVSEAPVSILSDDQKNAYLGEVKALRAFYYWHLVETWGPVQINTEPVKDASTVWVRSSETEVYAFMLKDVEEAITLLAAKTAKTGRFNLWAAKALYARLLIYKASKFSDQAAYSQAATVADEIITGSGASFYANYADCWSGANENGITNREVLWYVDYSTTLENNILPKR